MLLVLRQLQMRKYLRYSPKNCVHFIFSSSLNNNKKKTRAKETNTIIDG